MTLMKPSATTLAQPVAVWEPCVVVRSKGLGAVWGRSLFEAPCMTLMEPAEATLTQPVAVWEPCVVVRSKGLGAVCGRSLFEAPCMTLMEPAARKPPAVARSVAAPSQQPARPPDTVLHHLEATGGHTVPPAPPVDTVLHH
jgi:hypothetical protein